MTQDELKKLARDIAYEVESEVSFRIDSIVSDAVSDAVEDALGDLGIGDLSVTLALAFLCQTDPDNQEFSRINVDKAKMKDLLTRASAYITSIGDMNCSKLKRSLS
jgi:hypothetical protein